MRNVSVVMLIVVALAGCTQNREPDDGISAEGQTDLVRAAREAAAAASSLKVQQVQPQGVTVAGDCAAVEVTEPGQDKRYDLTAFMRRDGGDWVMMDYVTGHVSLRLDPDSQTCWT